EARATVRVAIFGERRDDIVDRLLRQDLADREDRRPLVAKRARDVGIGRDIELLPVDRDRHHRRVRAARGLELAAVVLAVGEPELGSLRELDELLAAVLGVPARWLFQYFEVLRRCEVGCTHHLVYLQ